MDAEVCLSKEEGEFSESCLHSQVRPRHHTKLTQLLQTTLKKPFEEEEEEAGTPLTQCVWSHEDIGSSLPPPLPSHRLVRPCPTEAAAWEESVLLRMSVEQLLSVEAAEMSLPARFTKRY